jgi:hypothetical protein
VILKSPAVLDSEVRLKLTSTGLAAS